MICILSVHSFYSFLYSLEGFALIGIVAPPIFEIKGALGALSEAFNILAAEQTGKAIKLNLNGFLRRVKY